MVLKLKRLVTVVQMTKGVDKYQKDNPYYTET